MIFLLHILSERWELNQLFNNNEINITPIKTLQLVRSVEIRHHKMYHIKGDTRCISLFMLAIRGIRTTNLPRREKSYYNVVLVKNEQFKLLVSTVLCCLSREN